MKLGVVDFYKYSEGYGFLLCEGESYFFHMTGIPSGVKQRDIKPGMAFMFEPKYAPKGNRADKLRLVESSFVASGGEFEGVNVRQSGFEVSRGVEPKRGEVVVRIPVVTPYFRTQEECKELLTSEANRIGSNALLNLQVNKERRSEAAYGGKGYHYYSEFSMTADFCLVVERQMSPISEVKRSNQLLARDMDRVTASAIQSVAKLRAARDKQQTSVFNTFGVWIALGVIVALGVGYLNSL